MLAKLSFFLGLADDKLDFLLVDGDVDFEQPSNSVEWVAGVAKGQLSVILQA
jgi:hypothetical protein